MNTITATTARALTICIAAALAISATAASAASPADHQSVTNGPLTYVVHFADLDLSKLDEVTRLYNRLDRAAHVVCEPLVSAHLADADKHRACLSKAIADAVVSIDSPLLSQTHQLHIKADTAGGAELAKAN